MEIETYVKLIQTADCLHTTVSKPLSEHKLTASQFSTLKVLRRDGALPQKEIARRMLITAGNVTLIIDNLERQGFVARIRQEHDRRVINVCLTELGRRMFDRVYPGHIERIEKAMSALSPEKLQTLCELLNELSPSSEPTAKCPKVS